MNRRTLQQVGIATVVFIGAVPWVGAAGLRDEAAAYRLDGFQRQQQGDFVGAVAAYQKAAALDPSYATPQNDLGVIYEQTGRLEEAKQAYLQALAVDAQHLQAHANLAMLAERLGEKEQAIYHWLKRYQLGAPGDAWTARAEERLVALGILTHPGLKGQFFTRRRVAEQELAAHEQSLNEFHTVTEQHSRWP